MLQHGTANKKVASQVLAWKMVYLQWLAYSLAQLERSAYTTRASLGSLQQSAAAPLTLSKSLQKHKKDFPQLDVLEKVRFLSLSLHNRNI